MHELYKYGSDLIIELANNPSGEVLKQLFEIRTAYWKHPHMEVECGGIGTFDDIKLKSTDAFDLIPTAVDICLEQTEPELIATSSHLLLTIIGLSDTTQIPKYLDLNWSNLINHFSNINAPTFFESIELAINELRRWYRKE